MSRPIRIALLLAAAVAVAAFAGACGTQRIEVSKADATHNGAVLFNARCSGCHTLAYAGTQGSATNPRTALMTNGPNFNVRCERPVARVLYAIENGGFSGAIMPQNIVVGHDARAVAQFVATYAGRQAPKIVGQAPCASLPIGALPQPGQSATAAASSSAHGVTPGPGTNLAPAAPLSTNPATGKKNQQSKPGRKAKAGAKKPHAARKPPARR